MNSWGEVRKSAIVEADDFQDRADRNGLNYIIGWKLKYPKFKITLFTIPDRTSGELIKFIRALNQGERWIELAVHGWNHESNFECWQWDEERIDAIVNRLERPATWNNEYSKVFKAPGWMITGNQAGEGSGYIPPLDTPVGKDAQAVYKGLSKHDYIITDRHYNHTLRPTDAKIICMECNPDVIHFHTWDMDTGDINGRNGFKQIEDNFGVPWDQETEFMLMSEAWKEGKYNPCSHK